MICILLTDQQDRIQCFRILFLLHTKKTFLISIFLFLFSSTDAYIYAVDPRSNSLVEMEQLQE